MDVKRPLPLGLLLGTACIGQGTPECDTATGLGCSEGDSDTDVDADTDVDSDLFDPWLFTVEMHTGYDGEHLVPYFVEGTEIAPYAVVRIYDERYRDDQPDQFVCEWSARMVERETTDLGVETLWQGFNVTFEHNPDAVRNDCDNFPSGQWADGAPTEALEALDFGFGWAPLSAGMAADLESAYTNAGMAWSDYEPYAFGVYWSVLERTTGGTVRTTEEMGYGYFDRVDEEMSLVFGESGLVSYVSVVEGMPERAAVETYYYYGFDVDSVLRR
ncbi:MAG: hypothetical protein GY913_21990 [Proteobacteria bacterium]|nr:hypothetical protein [Pseudomonadota bacterium]MCP4919583.1 hypothetical protein [Pseudomonadota bacterium]